MNIFLTILVSLWAIRIFLNILAYISLWYLKEYRWDRMLIHLRSPQGGSILFPPLRRPSITPKTIVLGVFSVAFLVFLGMSIPGSLFVRLLAVDALTFPVVSVLVTALKLPTVIYHAILIRMAVTKLRAHRPMIVIGITGSYGKTSTKEMLGTVLSRKYRVLTTKASKNSPIAIAEVVLAQLSPDCEVFIVEMGAYKKGEIAYMAKMVRPTIGIVTAVNAQHQDLFGSLENTIQAKYELVEGLTDDGIAIMNYDNEFVRRMAKKAEGSGTKVIGYTTNTSFAKECLYVGVSPVLKGNALTFTLKTKNETATVSISLVGTHHVSNTLATIAAARACGMTLDEIIQACRHITPVTRTMVPVPGVNQAQFIDDTFNNNPDAAKAALLYLGTRRGRRIMVFQPMIELGQYAQSSHEDVARLASQTISEIILTNDSYREAFEAYSGKMGVLVLSPKAAAEHIRKTVRKGDTVLFKGKQAAAVLQLLV